MEIVSYILSGLSLALLIAASLMKGTRIKLILSFVFSANMLIAINYLISNELNGAVTCFIGAVLTIINYFFSCKNKNVPLWLTIIYAIVFAGVNIMVSDKFSYPGIFVIIAALAFVMGITQKNGKGFRFWTVLNALCWCSYDLLTKLYPLLIQHFAHFLFTILGMVMHDLKKNTEANKIVKSFSRKVPVEPRL